MSIWAMIESAYCTLIYTQMNLFYCIQIDDIMIGCCFILHELLYINNSHRVELDIFYYNFFKILIDICMMCYIRTQFIFLL